MGTPDSIILREDPFLCERKCPCKGMGTPDSIFFDNLGHTSSGNVGNIWAEWGRGGSGWADTLGKRSHGLQEGF